MSELTATTDASTSWPEGSGRPAQLFLVGEGFADAVAEMQQRVASRLAADAARYANLDSPGKVLRTKTLVNEELEAWVSHRAQVGLPALSDADEDNLVAAILAALGGLGPLEPLLLRDDVEDIYYNGTHPTMLRLADGSKVAGPRLASTDEQLRQLLQSMAASPLDDSAGREFSVSRPLLQLRMKSVGLLGARMSAAMDVTPHPAGTIRVHRHVETSLPQLRDMGMIDDALLAFLTATVLAGGKVMVSGATGVGKTVLLRALIRAIPLDKMIVTIEDDRELGVHVVPERDETGRVVREPDGTVRLLRPPALVRSYEARPANSEGRGLITMGDLSRHSLRDSPDVICLGETRGADVVHLLDAASNGVAGVMCTIHSVSARGVFDRLVQMVRLANPPLPGDFALMAATSLDVIVHVAKNRAHERFVTEVIQVHSGGLGENGRPVTEQLFGPRRDGRAVPTGHKPTPELAERLFDVGFDLDWLNRGTSTWGDEAADSFDTVAERYESWSS
jgi:Flp pilus assembly CpaF family ATPase